MKTILVIILIVIVLFSWIFATLTKVNGKDTTASFWVRSFFYWIAVVLAFLVGCYI